MKIERFHVMVVIGISVLAIAVTLVISQFRAPSSQQKDVKTLDASKIEAQPVEWNKLFVEKKFYLSAQFSLWDKEEDIKQMSRAGEVAVAMEELKELKESYEKYTEQLNKLEKAAKAADEKKFKVFSAKLDTWENDVRAARRNYKRAVGTREYMPLHDVYLNVLFKTEIPPP